MGSVYRVHDGELGEEVALKVLRVELASDATAIDRFRREVKLARRVTHPNVARTFDLGCHDELRFLTMELVEGKSLASLMHKGVLSLDLVAQDGIRIRAAATAPSFRGHESLLECREQAALHLKAMLANADDPELSAVQKAARAAAARDFQQRVEEAISTVVELQKTRKPSDKPARASTTDAEARVMKMADGGFRPAYNVQMATAGSPLGGPHDRRSAGHQRG